MQLFHDFINLMNSYLWGPPMLIALFGTHLFLTYRLKFIQKYVIYPPTHAPFNLKTRAGLELERSPILI